MSNNNKYFTITKKQYKKMRRNKIELLFNVKVLKKKNGRQKFKILHEVENKPKIPIKIIEDQPESPKPLKPPKPLNRLKVLTILRSRILQKNPKKQINQVVPIILMQEIKRCQHLKNT